jgi:hypothetical protein
MKTVSLTPAQRRTQKVIEALGFGVIQRLVISEGQPCYDPTPHIVQSIKLGSRSEPARQPGDDGLLKNAFADLFERLATLCDCAVDIEVRHGLPFRLIVERDCTELLSSRISK